MINLVAFIKTAMVVICLSWLSTDM